uniref:RRM domain-containing protein n=1 Tax=Oryza brachyantha TaxID=4533 RepID=J3MNU0_ORYBR
MAAEEILAVIRRAARADDATVIRNRATGASRGCCFVVCPSREEADKAIAAYHNKCTLPGASRVMQVRYADGELERLDAEQKLFVGMLPRDVKDNEVSALFSQYGSIRQLKLLRSPQKTSKACAILEYESKEHARAAIEALNGMRVLFNGSDATLVVKLADTEKERQARRAQKAQAQPSKPLGVNLVPQLPIFGAPDMRFLPPYDVLCYKTEGTTDPELKDLMKMTNKLEMLVTELKRVVNLLENRVTYNDPILPNQHSHLSVEHDEKQDKPNEFDSKTLEVPGIMYTQRTHCKTKHPTALCTHMSIKEIYFRDSTQIYFQEQILKYPT